MNESKEQQDETMICGLNIQERDVLRAKLCELEDTVPPRAVWQRIEEQARAEGLFAPGISERTKWLAGAGLAAAVVLAVLNVPIVPVTDSGEQVGVTVPDYSDVAANNDDMRGLNALMVESRQIERNLRALPAQPSLVRASTVVTISELQDQVAGIDYLLNHPELHLSPGQEEIYWRERVRLMNSLLRLRTAQAQRMSF
ncbi:MAG: hypothetical protein IIA09_04555 [Proteobacteria bacterium]|nr:hypothetical protein [Pseudomonadota bacterium]